MAVNLAFRSLCTASLTHGISHVLLCGINGRSQQPPLHGVTPDTDTDIVRLEMVPDTDTDTDTDTQTVLSSVSVSASVSGTPPTKQHLEQVDQLWWSNTP
jgi:hypothetical protein